MAISRGFSAEDLNGVRLLGSVDALADIGVEAGSGIVCDLEFSFDIDKKTLWVCVEVGLDGTKKLITAALSCFLQVFLTSPLGGSREIVSALSYRFLFLDQIKYGTRHPRCGIPSLKPLGLYIVRDSHKKRVFPLMPVVVVVVVLYLNSVKNLQ